MLSYTVFRMSKTYFSYILNRKPPLFSNTDILFIPQFAFECVWSHITSMVVNTLSSLYRRYAGTSYLDDIFGFVRWFFFATIYYLLKSCIG